ncbi:glycosyltransferase family 4 protein [Fulvivirgaceae bacterium PWU4]|uniref:Glycosyltransferase family 4 protein n=1 Tax=Chryseosolibacter histidini TaxID=2782349 RepID=A0AAP2DR31_9BACT|nr:glycosyltransferase family 4 protein [Chryseosolibacter histidini]MBT1700925.1 glycosyltransferase family 4 protein [Chryseosolibacter histidini]
MVKKKKVLFVGAFNNTTQNTGGQLFACLSLVNSRLSEEISWRLIDSTATTNQQRSFFDRTFNAAKRVFRFVLSLFTFNPHTTLIFFADGASFIEKGIMALIAKLFFKRVVVCPRAGPLIDDIPASAFWRKFTRLVFSVSDVVVCQSDTWKTFFGAHIGFEASGKYVVIRNWINAEPYTENFKRRQQRASVKPLKVLFLGWIIKDKGIFELLEAFSNMKASEVQLWVAGDGQEMQAAKKRAAELNIENTVQFFGWAFSGKKMELLRDADIFVLPSYAEGMPNALLEAMASGLPSIATRVGGIPDVIHDGSNGFLVESKDAAALSEKIRLLAENESLRRQFSHAAHSWIQEKHSLQAAITAFDKIL